MEQSINVEYSKLLNNSNDDIDGGDVDDIIFDVDGMDRKHPPSLSTFCYISQCFTLSFWKIIMNPTKFFLFIFLFIIIFESYILVLNNDDNYFMKRFNFSIKIPFNNDKEFIHKNDEKINNDNEMDKDSKDGDDEDYKIDMILQRILPERKALDKMTTLSLIESASNLAALYTYEWQQDGQKRWSNRKLPLVKYCDNISLKPIHQIKQMNSYWQTILSPMIDSNITTSNPLEAREPFIIYIYNAYYDNRSGRSEVKILTACDQQVVVERLKFG